MAKTNLLVMLLHIRNSLAKKQVQIVSLLLAAHLKNKSSVPISLAKSMENTNSMQCALKKNEGTGQMVGLKQLYLTSNDPLQFSKASSESVSALR